MSKQENDISSKSDFTYDQWIYIREQYLDWLSLFLVNKEKDSIFLWRGFNLLYVTLPAKKDVEVENEWFKRIYLRIKGHSKPISVKLMPWYKFYIRFVFLFLYEYLKVILYKLYFSNSNLKLSSADIYFHSLSSNIQTSQFGTYDRHFCNAPMEDIKFRSRAAYVVTLVPGLNDIKHFSKFAREVKKKFSLLKRQVVVLNNCTTFSTINEVYFSVFYSWLKFRKEARKLSFQKTFDIKKVSCADILISEIEKSYLGEIQWSLIYGLSFQKWIKMNRIQAPVITYGETLSPMRPVYFFSKQENYKIKFFSIQHSINNRNKIGLFHRKNDFQTKNDLINFLILPDYYLLQGNQSSEISKEFYPINRIKIIGCLKYDDMNIFNLNKIKQINYNLLKYKNKLSKKVLLIAPSVNDLSSLLTLFTSTIFSKWRIVIRPHPANNIVEVEELVKQADLIYKIEIITNFSTNELFSIADLVVCGYSASCYEAIINNIPAVQFLNLHNMPLVEPDDDIPSFSKPMDFWDWFMKFDTMNLNFDFKNISEKILKKYFYKLDGKSSERLWQYIIENKY